MDTSAVQGITRRPADRRLYGVLIMLTGACVLSITDAAGKWVVGGYPLIQLNFVRSIFAVLVLAPLLWRAEGAAGWHTRRPWPHFWRGMLLIGLAYGWFLALKFMPLADTVAIAMCAPLFMTILSVPLLGEHVGWRRWGAVAVGFAGMLLIIRPGTEVFQAVSILPVLAAFGYALYMVTNRVLSVTESMTTLTLFPQLAVLIVSAALVPFVWVTPDLTGFLAMALTGVAAGLGHLCLTVAFRHAPASLLAPLDYTALVWATVFGWLLFGTLPSEIVVTGMTLIVAAGLFIIWRAATAQPQPSAG